MSTTNQVTLFTFEQMSAQDIFNLGLRHIRTTKVKGERHIPNELLIGINANGGTMCSYFGSGCVASPLIREECREQADNVGAWGELTKERLVPYHHGDLIQNMQHAHDDTPAGDEFLANFEARMRNVAINHMLEFPEPEVPA